VTKRNGSSQVRSFAARLRDRSPRSDDPRGATLEAVPAVRSSAWRNKVYGLIGASAAAHNVRRLAGRMNKPTLPEVAHEAAFALSRRRHS
jgi:hypothetical protein